MTGQFVVLEGGDGSGKSTQRDLLVPSWLRQQDLDVSRPRSPAGRRSGVELRRLLLDGARLSDRAEALLMAADRAAARCRGDPSGARGRELGRERPPRPIVARVPGCRAGARCRCGRVAVRVRDRRTGTGSRRAVRRRRRDGRVSAGHRPPTGWNARARPSMRRSGRRTGIWRADSAGPWSTAPDHPTTVTAAGAVAVQPSAGPVTPSAS